MTDHITLNILNDLRLDQKSALFSPLAIVYTLFVILQNDSSNERITKINNFLRLDSAINQSNFESDLNEVRTR